MPNISETWGLVVNEAMAAGLPVLVSRKCGCYPNLVREGISGFLFDPYKINELCDLIKKISQGWFNLSAMGKKSLKIIRRYLPKKATETILNTIKFVIK